MKSELIKSVCLVLLIGGLFFLLSGDYQEEKETSELEVAQLVLLGREYKRLDFERNTMAELMASLENDIQTAERKKKMGGHISRVRLKNIETKYAELDDRVMDALVQVQALNERVQSKDVWYYKTYLQLLKCKSLLQEKVSVIRDSVDL